MEANLQSLPHGYVLQGKKNRYVIDKVLGQGSFGITYLAKFKAQLQGSMGIGSVQSTVAIKEFFMREMNTRDGSTGYLNDASQDSIIGKYRRDFLREARNLSYIQHPNIVNVFEVIEANNTAYIVMEYKDGGSLDEHIAHRGRLTEAEALRLFEPICDAMNFMHAQHMLHLDLKPKNVMLDEEGTPFLIDFGLSKHFTQNGEPESSTSIGLGTPGYAPSEQAEQRDGDKSFRATIDIYALGGTLYKMLTAETPPNASEILNDDELLSANLQEAGIGKKLIQVIEKAMMPASRKRYQSVAELMKALGWTAKVYEEQVKPFSENQKAVPKSDEEETRIITEEPQPSINLNGDTKVTQSVKSRKPAGNSIVWKKYLYGGIVVALVAVVIGLVFLLSERGNSQPTSVPDDNAFMSESIQTTEETGNIVQDRTEDGKQQETEKEETRNVTNSSSNPQKTIVSSVKNPKWGRYDGARNSDGLPHGNGIVFITGSTSLNGVNVSSGDRIEGVFRNGYLNFGTLYKQDGTEIKLKDINLF